MEDAAAVRNFRDFLQLYNKLTESCFKRCVDNIHSRTLEPNEAECVEACTQKFIYYNNKLMQNFIRAQSEIIDKRMKEAEEQQQLTMNQGMDQSELPTDQLPTEISVAAN